MLHGTDDYFISDDVALLLEPIPFTVSAWVYPGDVSRGVPFSFHSSGTNRNLLFWAQDNSNAKFYHYDCFWEHEISPMHFDHSKQIDEWLKEAGFVIFNNHWCIKI